MRILLTIEPTRGTAKTADYRPMQVADSVIRDIEAALRPHKMTITFQQTDQHERTQP